MKIIIIIIIIIISHASVGSDIKKKRKESKQEQSRPVADWTLSLRQPGAYGLLDQPLDCSQSEMKKRDGTNRVKTNRIRLTQYFHMVILNHKVISIA